MVYTRSIRSDPGVLDSNSLPRRYLWRANLCFPGLWNVWLSTGLLLPRELLAWRDSALGPFESLWHPVSGAMEYARPLPGFAFLPTLPAELGAGHIQFNSSFPVRHCDVRAGAQLD